MGRSPPNENAGAVVMGGASFAVAAASRHCQSA